VISKGKRNRVGYKGSGGSLIGLILDTGLSDCGFKMAELLIFISFVSFVVQI